MLLTYCAGPWQVMIKQSDGSYACVAESATRFTLGEVILHCLYLKKIILFSTEITLYYKCRSYGIHDGI